MPPLTGFPLEVIDTPFESTDALAAGPKHGSLLFHQLSDLHMVFCMLCLFDLTAKYSHACAAKYSQAGFLHVVPF